MLIGCFAVSLAAISIAYFWLAVRSARSMNDEYMMPADTLVVGPLWLISCFLTMLTIVLGLLGVGLRGFGNSHALFGLSLGFISLLALASTLTLFLVDWR
jgi:hypothetical protein